MGDTLCQDYSDFFLGLRQETRSSSAPRLLSPTANYSNIVISATPETEILSSLLPASPIVPCKSDKTFTPTSPVPKIAAVLVTIKDFKVSASDHDVSVLIVWNDGQEQWMDEREVQGIAANVLLAFWDSKGGPYQATTLNLYHVFAIIDSEKKGRGMSL
ncbi:hypothetical protein FAVG1_13089 [Fusarium avenaceum]|nr:hypothetical protein FAVG1_13089 [Fusarium avenaceum]